ncbi:MAG: hypothetical protein R6U26_03470 [Candidatus Undinarchaeales archaeon]
MNLDKLISKIKHIDLKEMDLLRPESVLAFYSIFLLLAGLSFLTDLPIQRSSLLSFAVIFASFPFFILGIKAGKFLYGKEVPWYLHILLAGPLIIIYSFVLKGFFFENIGVPLLISVSSILGYYFILVKCKERIDKILPFGLMMGGILVLMLTLIRLGGIPLVNHELRFLVINNLHWGASIFLFFTGFILLLPRIKSKKNILIFTFLSTAVFSVMAFRNVIIVLLLTGVFSAYYFKDLKIGKVLVGLVAAFVIVVVLGYFTMPLTGPIRMLLYRAGTTHIVFDEIVRQAWPTGLTHGSLYLQGNPRLFVGSEIMSSSSGKSLTFTLLGGSFLDFGIFGASAWMFSLGTLLSLAYKSMQKGILGGFYPLLFSFTLVWIEIGVDQFQILFFVMFLIAYMLKYTNFPKAQFLKRH